MTTLDPERRSLAPRLPYSLGRFTLCKAVGSGGMATVYLSKMRLGGGLDRLVALKTIHQHLAKEQTFVDMFLDEARIASQIAHPNVCAVYDFGSVDDVYYLAMEYLVGEPLFDVINRVVAERSDDLLKALPYIAARIIADACEGLHAAHDLKGVDGTHLGVVHRDVSPQNLFITYEGAVKVVDFGCAKALERVTQTNTGVMKGKVSYAAPEQLRSEDVDARADVFALGICLWETLTLRQLFRRDTAIKTALAVMEEPIPRANAGAPWVPGELADIAEKALNRDPKQRYQDARELGRALRGFVARTGVPFESAEIAEWMKHLFRDRHDEVLESVAEVEALEITPSMVTSQAELVDADTQHAQDFEGAPLTNPPLGLPSAASSSSRRERAPLLGPEDERKAAPPSKGPGRALGMMVVLALVAAGAYAALKSDPEPPLASEPPVEHSPESEQVPVDPAQDLSEATPTAPIEPDPVEPDPAEASETTSDERRRDRRHARERDESEVDEDGEGDALGEAEFTTGSVRIVANGGWAMVVHHGRRLGRTPITTTLPIGSQVLTLYPFGFEPGEQVTVRIEPRTLQRMTIEVDPRDDPAGMDTAGMDTAPMPDPEN